MFLEAMSENLGYQNWGMARERKWGNTRYDWIYRARMHRPGRPIGAYLFTGRFAIACGGRKFLWKRDSLSKIGRP